MAGAQRITRTWFVEIVPEVRIRCVHAIEDLRGTWEAQRARFLEELSDD